MDFFKQPLFAAFRSCSKQYFGWMEGKL